MKKCYLALGSPSWPDGERLAARMLSAFQRQDVEVLRSPPGQPIHQRVQEANRWGADLYYAPRAHTDGGMLRGNVIYYYMPEAKAMGQRIQMRYADLYPKDDPEQPVQWLLLPNADLTELRLSHAPALWDGLIFRDNPEDVLWFQRNLDDIARNKVQGICEALGIPYRS